MMHSLLLMTAMSAALAVSAAWATSREMPDGGLPQPRLADPPEVIVAMPCGHYKLLRLEVAASELAMTIQRLRDRQQTDQVRRVLAERRRQHEDVVTAIMQTAPCLR